MLKFGAILCGNARGVTQEAEHPALLSILPQLLRHRCPRRIQFVLYSELGRWFPTLDRPGPLRINWLSYHSCEIAARFVEARRSEG